MENKALPSDRAGGLRPEPAAQSQPEALIPSADDDSILRSKARALAKSVWDERRKAALTFDGLSFEAREILVDCCLKGMCVGIIAGSSLVRDGDPQGIEAGTAETQGGSVHESPSGEAGAPETITTEGHPNVR